MCTDLGQCRPITFPLVLHSLSSHIQSLPIINIKDPILRCTKENLIWLIFYLIGWTPPIGLVAWDIPSPKTRKRSYFQTSGEIQQECHFLGFLPFVMKTPSKWWFPLILTHKIILALNTRSWGEQTNRKAYLVDAGFDEIVLSEMTIES